jgi:hypothetical protein
MKSQAPGCFSVLILFNNMLWCSIFIFAGSSGRSGGAPTWWTSWPPDPSLWLRPVLRPTGLASDHLRGQLLPPPVAPVLPLRSHAVPSPLLPATAVPSPLLPVTTTSKCPPFASGSVLARFCVRHGFHGDKARRPTPFQTPRLVWCAVRQHHTHT